MPYELTPRKMQEQVQLGYKRLRNFRRARIMFLRNYAGQYYDAAAGDIATEPLGLIFNAVNVLVPNLVMASPKHVIKARYLAYREYGELLGMALDQNARDIRLRNTLRRWLVDALFGIGILKTGLCDSDTAVGFDDSDQIDPGTIYTEVVDLDDFAFDPAERSDIRAAAWYGHHVQAPRGQVLDSGLYRNDLIERLPRAGTGRGRGSEQLSMHNSDRDEADAFHDYIDLTEVWVRGANAIVTIPGSDLTCEDYLRVADYYGPSKGPFTFLMLTPPPSNNPMPVAPVGVWNDLHIMANRMCKKIIDQAERQKDLVTYKRAAADDAQEVVDAADGETVGLDDPESVKVVSFGGQKQSNEAHLSQLMMWFNLVSGNTEALGGVKSDAATATQAQILQQNGSVRIEDLKDIVYFATADEAAIRAWYLHTDPLIQVPLIRREQVPAKYTLGPDGAMNVSPATSQDVQVFLTPEARRGDFLDYQFEIQPESMSRMDPQLRLQRALDFGIKLIPAAATAAQVCFQMGVPFSFQVYVTRMAKEAGIEWMDEVFQDPAFQMQMMEQMMKTPGMANSQGTATGPKAGGAAGIMQNGQPPGVASGPPSAATARNQSAQAGAVSGQRAMSSNDRY